MLFRVMVLSALGLAAASQLDESGRRATFGVIGAIGRDVATFCDRHPNPCRDGRQTIGRITGMIGEGARAASEHIGAAWNRDAEPVIVKDGSQVPRETLARDDRLPAWRDPSRSDNRLR